MSSIRIRPVALAAVLLTLASCRNPQTDVLVAEQMRQIGDELMTARQETAAVRETVDSLRNVVARQDTLLRTLAGMANVPLPPR